MAGRRTGTPKTGGRRAGTPNKRTVALRTATATAAKQISAALGSEVFYGDAHALLMTVYKDLSQPIGLRMEAAKAALPYEKPRLASIENKVVDEFDTMNEEQLEAWLDERAEARVKMKQRASAEVQRHGIRTPRSTMAGQASLIPHGREGSRGAATEWGDDRGICDRHSGAVARRRR
jgi:hypothetical protein